MKNSFLAFLLIVFFIGCTSENDEKIILKNTEMLTPLEVVATYFREVMSISPDYERSYSFISENNEISLTEYKKLMRDVERELTRKDIISSYDSVSNERVGFSESTVNLKYLENIDGELKIRDAEIQLVREDGFWRMLKPYSQYPIGEPSAPTTTRPIRKSLPMKDDGQKTKVVIPTTQTTTSTTQLELSIESAIKENPIPVGEDSNIYECNESKDCGTARSYLKCSGNKIMRFYETPSCKFNLNSSYCTNTLRNEIFERCPTDTICINEICERIKSTSTTQQMFTITTTVFTIPTTTTTITIPDATFCWGRTYARNQADCSDLKCPKGDCKYIGEGASGHCYCQY